MGNDLACALALNLLPGCQRAPTFAPTPVPTFQPTSVCLEADPAPLLPLAPGNLVIPADNRAILPDCVLRSCFFAVDFDNTLVFRLAGQGSFSLQITDENNNGLNFGIVVTESLQANRAFCGAHVTNPPRADLAVITFDLPAPQGFDTYLVVGPSSQSGPVPDGSNILIQVKDPNADLCGAEIMVQEPTLPLTSQLGTFVRYDPISVRDATCPLSLCPAVGSNIIAVVRLPPNLGGCFISGNGDSNQVRESRAPVAFIEAESLVDPNAACVVSDIDGLLVAPQQGIPLDRSKRYYAVFGPFPNADADGFFFGLDTGGDC